MINKFPYQKESILIFHFFNILLHYFYVLTYFYFTFAPHFVQKTASFSNLFPQLEQ